jgi:hypothetical protein
MATKEYNLDLLDYYLSLSNNQEWGDILYNHFDINHIQKVKSIVESLEIQPWINPTNFGSIQLEYKKDNGDYLEFEIYNDSIEVFYIIGEYDFTYIIPKEEIQKYITLFYEK